MSRMKTLGAGLVALMLAGGVTAAVAAEQTPADRTAEQPSEVWGELRETLFGDTPVLDGAGIIKLGTPYRAHDAGLVPVEVAITPPEGTSVKTFSIIIDLNPAPVAGEFEVGPGMPRDLALSTRIRVDQYSNVRVVAEMADGRLFQTARFVKASGGCSAPASKDMEAALASLGKMKVRLFEEPAGTLAQSPGLREAQVMMKHPNYSGLSMDQVTRLFVPAHFVDELAVMQGDEMVFRMTGGISISEDPSIRFSFVPNGAEMLTIKARDTEGTLFERSFPSGASG